MTRQGRQALLWILTLGVFSIINTEMGIIGILPLIAKNYGVSLSQAGLLVSLFALAVAFSGPIMPLLFSGVNRKHAMVAVLGVFCIGNLVSAFAGSFPVLLAARVIPAFFHPVYCALAFTTAAASVEKQNAPKAVARVLMGVSAGMVLGVPIISYIAGATSLKTGMLTLFGITAGVLLATVLLIPSMPVKEKQSGSSQLRVLKKRPVWLAILAVIFLNGAVFGVYSFFAGFLESVTGLSGRAVSAILLIYGLANAAGNIIGGKGLSRNPAAFIRTFPFLLGGVYAALLIVGGLTLWAAILTPIWGLLAGAGANINQYLLMSAAPEAPDFANGLFLTSTNLGTTFGAMLCGTFISGFGIRFSLAGGVLFLIPAVILITAIFPLFRRTKSNANAHEPSSSALL